MHPPVVRGAREKHASILSARNSRARTNAPATNRFAAAITAAISAAATAIAAAATAIAAIATITAITATSAAIATASTRIQPGSQLLGAVQRPAGLMPRVLRR